MYGTWKLFPDDTHLALNPAHVPRSSTSYRRKQRLVESAQDGDTDKSRRDAPTMINSAGISNRRKQKRALRMGQPSMRRSLMERGESTSESHAATVSVQTKKYL
jgi:hypothetical protein